MADGSRRNCSFYFHVLVPVFSITLYYADLISDIVLAVKYYTQGHKSWAFLTALFILFPVPVYIAMVTYMSCVYKTWKSLQVIISFVICFPIMLLINSFGLCSYLAEVLQHKKMDSKFQAKRLATMNQVFEALLEASPQCVLQLYIILIDRSTSDSGDISTGRYVSIATSAVAISWNFFCHEKMMYILCQVEQSSDTGGCAIRIVEEPVRPSIRQLVSHHDEEEDEEDKYKMPVYKQLCLLILKVCECIQRVLAFALFLSLLRYRIPFIFIILAHIIILTIADFLILDDSGSVFKRISKCISASILRVICYTSTNSLPNSIFRVFSHFILVNIENWIFVGLWLAQKPERHQWLFTPILVIFISLFVVQIILQLLYYIKLDNHDDEEDMNNVMSVFFDMDTARRYEEDDKYLGMMPGQQIIMKAFEGVE